jgi:hypothetical protein
MLLFTGLSMSGKTITISSNNYGYETTQTNNNRQSRLQLLINYLRYHKEITVKEYSKLVNVTTKVGQSDLKQFVSDKSSGIVQTKNGKKYTLDTSVVNNQQNGGNVNNYNQNGNNFNPNGNGTNPNGNGTNPNGNGTNQNGNNFNPNGNNTNPNGNGTNNNPNGNGTNPNGNGTNPNGNNTNPNGNGTNPNGNNNNQNGNTNQNGNNHR